VDPVPLADWIQILAPAMWQDLASPVVLGQTIVIYRRQHPDRPKCSTDHMPVQFPYAMNGVVADVLRCLPGELLQVRLIRLGVGGSIRPHIDHGFRSTARIHFVIESDPAVVFTIDGTRLHMKLGELWCLNVGLRHSVRNGSHGPRVHLVIDVRRNAATGQLLRRSVKRISSRRPS
jgi:quercetin dioxygenase-like cupin family protein